MSILVHNHIGTVFMTHGRLRYMRSILVHGPFRYIRRSVHGPLWYNYQRIAGRLLISVLHRLSNLSQRFRATYAISPVACHSAACQKSTLSWLARAAASLTLTIAWLSAIRGATITAVIYSLIAFASNRVGFYVFIATFIEKFLRHVHISYAARLSGSFY